MTTTIEERPFTAQCIDAREMLDVTTELIDGLVNTPRRVFRAIGAISLDGVEIFAGYKTRAGFDRGVERWAHEAILADIVMERFPETANSFPVLTIPIEDHNLDRLRGGGLLTEDFTENGAHPLHEYRRHFNGLQSDKWSIESELEQQVLDALDGTVYKEAFQHMAGFAGLREVMVDFNEVHYPTEAVVEEYMEVGKGLVLDITEYEGGSL